MQDEIDALFLRIDQVIDTIELVGTLEDMHRICAQLPDEKRVQFIHQYAEQLKSASERHHEIQALLGQ